MSWTYELTLHSGATTLHVLEAQLIIDEAWSPYGQARVTVPGNPALAGRLAASPVTLRLHGTDHDTAATFTHDLVLWQYARRQDHEAGTTIFELATVEWLLHEKYALAPWTPAAPFEPSVVLQGLCDQAGLDVTVMAMGTMADIPADQIVPWEAGQTAWQWWDRMRQAAGVSTQGSLFALGPDRNIIEVAAWGGPPYFDGGAFWTALAPLEHTQEYLPDEYADSLAVTWQWSDAAGEAQEVRELATPSPRYTTRRHVEMRRSGELIPGVAQRIIDARAKYLYKHELVLPLTYAIASTLRLPDFGNQPVPAARLEFDFSDEPTVRATVFRSI